jgi:hypothetical protein
MGRHSGNTKRQTKSQKKNKRFEVLDINGKKFSYESGGSLIRPMSRRQLCANDYISLYRSAGNLGITCVFTKKGRISLAEYCNILDLEVA